MKKRKMMKKGIAFSMAAAIGTVGMATSGWSPAVRAYASEPGLAAQAVQSAGATAVKAADGAEGKAATKAADGAEGKAATKAADGAKTEDTPQVLAGFDFNNGIGGWSYGAGWEYNYSAKDVSAVEADNGRLKFQVDYSGDKDKDWSQATAVWEPQDEKALDLKGANCVSMQFIYDAANMSTGSFAVKVYGEGLDANADVDFSAAKDISGGLKQVLVTIPFAALGDPASQTKQFAVQLIGKNTDYKGAVWFDDIQIAKQAEPDVSVDSTVAAKPADTQQVSIADGMLLTQKKDGSIQKTKLASDLVLVDKRANEAAKKVYAYLKAVGASDSVIYGHQNDICNKAGSEALSDSDTKDVTGSAAGIFGIDTLSLTGDEFNVEKYNKKFGASTGQILEDTPQNTVKAAAALTNAAIGQGMVVTLSSHMPNFANVKTRQGYKKGEPSYAKYDFTGYTPGVTANDPVNQILPGGKYNSVYTAYLDMVADYAKQVDGAILFRPFHENTGSWFWWGAAFCDPEVYKNVYRYTVEYLRDTKNVHNLLYAYGPGSEAESVKAYGTRYPGDAYVDLVGFDMYDNKPASDGAFMEQFKKQLQVVEGFAKQHGKLVAVTETGASNDGGLALLKQGNGNKDWYNQILDIISGSEASYFLLWANWGKDGAYYTPYVDTANTDGSLHGHEMLDNFLSFYNDGRSIFAANQKQALSGGAFGKLAVKSAAAGANGYFTAPSAGVRILKASDIQAKITGATEKTKLLIVAKTDKGKVKLTPKLNSKGLYTARLTTKQLQALGKGVGTLTLYVDNQRMQRYSVIYNIKAPKDDPYLIDGFEHYYGVDEQLASAWTVQSDNGCKVSVSLNKDKKSEGEYGLQFVYDETATGWGGATIAKEVDWSGCNALQFYMVPDGKNQKTVIQVNANGVTYEAYLQEYEAYRANGTKPVQITIPFSEFCQRDTQGNPKGGLAADSQKVQSFGLWVNAVADSNAVKDGRVSGTLYYDNITAVKSDVKEFTIETVE